MSVAAGIRRVGILVLLLVPCLAQAQNAPADPLRATSAAYQSLAERVNQAVVQIHARRYSPIDASSSPSRLADQPSTGSGVFVDASGVIVTNSHVVDGAYEVFVRLPRPPQGPPGEASILRPRGLLKPATVVGIDAETDVAVLRIDGEGYPSLPFGDSDRLRPGQIVFAFGSPLGLENSVSMGVISATARQLRENDPMIYVQTDAPINPGSSGGPLVNTDGEIVGLNTLILSSSGENNGLGFAAPSNIVAAVSSQLRNHGVVRRGVIGVHAQTIIPELATELNLDGPERVILSDVLPGSPAERAGLKPGDRVRTLNGEVMENGRQFDVNLYGALGTLAALEVVRDGETIRTSVRVVERQDDRTRFAELTDPDEHRVDRLGILTLPLSGPIRDVLPRLRLSSGLLIAISTAAPTPWGDRLRPGDVLSVVDGVDVSTPDDLRDVLRSKASGSRIVAHVLREGRMQFVVLIVD